MRKMPATVVLGAQWGDEGKGKLVDRLAESATWVARFQGGNNAGHTVVLGDRVLKFHLLPSGITREDCGLVPAGGGDAPQYALLHQGRLGHVRRAAHPAAALRATASECTQNWARRRRWIHTTRLEARLSTRWVARWGIGNSALG